MNKIWHLNSNRWNSAITEYSLRAAQSLKLRNWDVVYSGLEGKPASQRAKGLGIQAENFSDFSLLSLPRFLKLYHQIKPDIISVYGGPETTLARFAWGAKVVRFRGQDGDQDKSPSPIPYRLSQGRLAGVIAPSHKIAENFSHLGHRTTSVALGCDPKEFFVDGWGAAERPILTILGRLDPIKGHGAFFLWYSLLLQSWPETLPRPLLRIIGEPANVTLEQIMGFAADVNLRLGEDWELVAERVSNVRRALSESSLGIICSQGSEVICRVAEEFLLCGCPIYVSGVGSLEECLIDPIMGASYKDKLGMDAVKPMMDWLIRSFQETNENKEHRSRLAREHFSLESMGNQLEEFLLQVGPSHLRGFEPSAAPTNP